MIVKLDIAGTPGEIQRVSADLLHNLVLSQFENEGLSLRAKRSNLREGCQVDEIASSLRSSQ